MGTEKMKTGSKALVLSAIFILVLVGIFFAFTKGIIPKRVLELANLTQTTEEKTENAASEEAEVSTSGKTQEIAQISLTITSPADGSVLGSTNATVKGKTVAGAEVFVNDAEGKADTSGNFSINVALEEGENIIVVSANDSNGNVAEKQITVTVSSFE